MRQKYRSVCKWEGVMERGRHTKTHTHTRQWERKKMNQRPSDKGRRGKKVKR